MVQLKTDKMIAEKQGGIGWMIFNNPERRNALSLEMQEAIPGPRLPHRRSVGAI